jgi:hypothetical protein
MFEFPLGRGSHVHLDSFHEDMVDAFIGPDQSAGGSVPEADDVSCLQLSWIRHCPPSALGEALNGVLYGFKGFHVNL